ncbi:hypothetical protein TNIN_453911 [Trichonephila inaurata madagascariensis]|uniref:Uncharacterized protein n=1 Tax=Trichonephila inaurata madagascariensis TaxID=2747483 RepID=A0A8X7C4A6_9ARAC|nr:hypothetical protein TNIN_453911 [Trichonephila inaurata madagascariensis]
MALVVLGKLVDSVAQGAFDSCPANEKGSTIANSIDDWISLNSQTLAKRECFGYLAEVFDTFDIMAISRLCGLSDSLDKLGISILGTCESEI